MASLHKFLRCFFAAWLCLLPVPAAALTPESGMKSGISLVPHMSILRDDSLSLTIQDVSTARAGEFVPVTRHLNIGFTSSAWWLRVPLDFKDSHSAWWLEIFPSLLDDIQLYVPRAGGGFERLDFGDTRPIWEGVIPARDFVVPLHNISGDYYLRVQTTGTFQPRITLWQPEFYTATNANIGAIFGVYYGIALFTILFNLILWRWLQERMYLYYSAYLFIYVTAQFFTLGFALLYLPVPTTFIDLMQKTLNGLLFMATFLFFDTLFKYKSRLPRLHRVMRMTAIFMACAAAITLSGLIPYPGTVVSTLGALGVLLILFAGFWLLWRGVHSILYYFIAFFACAVVTLLYALSAIRLFDWTSNLDFLPMSASLIHIVLLSAGLLRRSRKTEQTKAAAERQALHNARESEHELEKRVALRTRELAQSNSLLQQEISSREVLQQHLLSTLSAKQQALKFQQEFFAMASHEFRTPLAIIDATTHRVMLQRDDMRAPLEKIQRASRRIRTMIDTFLTEDKMEAAVPVARPETCDLRDIIATVISPDRCEGAHRIHADMSTSPVPIHCDRNLIALVLSNLVSNALKYSPEDSDIDVCAFSDASHAYLKVKDEGVGIPADNLEKIFQKYARLESVSGIEGTGFGLYISRLIAQRHGGDILVTSEPGKGSCFTLMLPLSSSRGLVGKTRQ